MFEEVVTQGESEAVPVEGVRVAGPLSQMRASVDALERVSGGRRIRSVIVFVFSEIIPHRTKILSWSVSASP